MHIQKWDLIYNNHQVEEHIDHVLSMFRISEFRFTSKDLQKHIRTEYFGGVLPNFIFFQTIKE